MTAPEPADVDVAPEPSLTPIFNELTARFFPPAGAHAQPEGDTCDTSS
ncbi:MAG TPA: hypothetical protein VFQ42_04230 [Mycobacterium sp.]|nr:hypothetical protein [Mycobacterium sp.]